MRLLLFTNRDLASNIMLNLLLPELCIHHDVRVYLSDAVGKNTEVPEPLSQLKFFEQKLLNDVLFPALDGRPLAIGHHYLSFAALAQAYAVTIESLNDVKSPEILAYFQTLAPDLVLSVRYGKIFGPKFLQIPRLGVINLHSGLLPAYRGVLATFRALHHGDREIGCTLHYIEDGTIDTGGIIGFAKTSVHPERSLLWHILSLYPVAAPLVLKTIAQIANGEKPATQPQTTEGAAYYTFPTAAELADFLEKGWKMVNYEEVLDLYRQYL